MTATVRVFVGAFVTQLRLGRRDDMLWLVLLWPLMIAVVLQLVLDASGRGDLGAFAVIGPMLVAVWQMALFVAGVIVSREREQGTLEPLVASPAPASVVLVGRITAIVGYSLLGFVEAVVIAVVFDRPVTVHHPGVFALAAVLTAAAAAATSLVIATLLVWSRTAITYQNSISYPILVLGGAVVPVALLPGWLQPVSRLVFLSWSGDLLRASLHPATVPQPALRLAMLAGLGIIGFVGGHQLLRTALGRARRDGTLALS